MRALLTLVLVLVSLAYPLIIYLGLQHVGPAVFAGLLLALALLRLLSARDRRDLTQLLLLLVAVAFSLALAVTGSELLLRFYPVAISLVLAGVFASSLRQPENLLARMARATGKAITPRALAYTRRLTLIWALLLLANAAVALYLALFASLYQWMLYCGFLSYLILGGFFLAELLYRRYYIARYGP